MNIKMWIITPFVSMQAVAEQVVAERARELANCDIVVSTSHCDISGFQDSLVELRKAQEWGAEVIVSRGGTAAYIAEHTDIPVVEIEVTALDMLRAFNKAGKDASTIGLAGFRNVIYECESLYDFLGTQLRLVTILDDCDDAGMRQAVDEGIQILVGDALAIRFANTAGISCILIESGKASIYKAIREAESVVRVRRREQARTEMLRTIIDSSTDGIVAVDEAARITLFNKAAEDIFGFGQEQAAGRPVADVIPNTRLPHVLSTGEAEIGELQIIGKRQIATKRIPIRTGDQVTGVVATFQEVSQLQKFEQSIRRKLYDKGLTARFHLDQIVGDSPALSKAKELARTYAATDSTVMITGETGTGKELFAQGIHNLSPRRAAPFVAVNCAALPESLLESELFGYEEGAFSGARKGGKIGLVELAHRGTLFLDEIGEMPLALQTRILRMIQEKEVMRLGGDRINMVNVRILVAANQDLTRLVAMNRFREDLFYRLNVLPLQLPPLRERPEDIGCLAEHFARSLAVHRRPAKRFTPEAIEALREYPWFGNVRELANVVERLVLLSPGAEIGRQEVAAVLSVPAKQARVTRPTAGDAWPLVEEYRKLGMGARKIARALAQQGYDIKYYQVAYRLDKAKNR
ncbi:sigma 54-interacting transcriptional regulator [Anaeroselena agilis]|uniref:Sigma 54-interacting transcriptional regulator n=1 Tax=Anaeroselena agilis TaxID=3063788 RepID=A0ABU3NYR1_9FIRM|nr:sigma 54-interacting transcriptional regulator [Selenomonadales bacterium 4137-cl]